MITTQSLQYLNIQSYSTDDMMIQYTDITLIWTDQSKVATFDE